MGRPSDKQIAVWKKACEEANPDCNRFEVYPYMEPVEAYVALTDLIRVMYQTNSKYREDFEFFCWRLNEMAPIAECPEGEAAAI